MVEFTSNFNSCIFLGTNTPVKFVAKVACLFRGQIDPLIIFGRDILNFIAGLARWRGLSQTLNNSGTLVGLYVIRESKSGIYQRYK